MTDIITLLALPETTKAFTSLKSTVVDSSVDDDGSGSPPRKQVRLDADSSSGSARYRNHNKRVARAGPIRIQVSGDPITCAVHKLHDQYYAQVRRSIRILLTKDSTEPLPTTYEGIYSACRAIVCVSEKGEGLYETLKLEIEQCVGRLARSLSEDKQNGMSWLNVFNETCGWFEKQVALLQSLLTYLDRVYVLKLGNTPSIRALAFSLFSQGIFESPDIMSRSRNGIEEWITWERDFRLQHEFREYVVQLVSHLLTHGQYSGMFESFYVECTTKFYTKESQELSKPENIASGGAPSFLKHCNVRIEEEQQRCKDVLPSFSWGPARKATEEALLLRRVEWLAKEAIGPLLDARNLTELANMYRLFARVDALKVLCASFKKYILSKVSAIVKDVAHDDDMVERLLNLKKFLDSTLASPFAQETAVAISDPSSTENTSNAPGVKRPNQDFSYALIDAFQNGFKARRIKPAEMIAKHLDRLMRKGQRDMSDGEFMGMLHDALALYRFTDDKDVFRTFYQRALAKRLLLERSASDDFEKSILKKLKEEYDPEFGMGDHMFTDLSLSRDLMHEYHSRLGDDDSAHKLNVMVLQRSVWPFATRKEAIDLPPSMQSDITKFGVFYKTKHQGRKLDWDHSLGSATVKARFKPGVKDLTVSLYQAVVLLLFNDNAEIPFLDIKENTRMTDDELRRTLQSLACGNKKVLKKRPAGRDVNDEDIFYFNSDFADPRAKVHINSIQSKETPEESRRTQSAIEGDRKHVVDAAIVRVMKAKKELHFEQLKVATIDAVKNHFVPDVSSIKQRISSLVEQEYLRRDDEDMNLYIYVA